MQFRRDDERVRSRAVDGVRREVRAVALVEDAAALRRVDRGLGLVVVVAAAAAAAAAADGGLHAQRQRRASGGQTVPARVPRLDDELRLHPRDARARAVAERLARGEMRVRGGDADAQRRPRDGFAVDGGAEDVLANLGPAHLPGEPLAALRELDRHDRAHPGRGQQPQAHRLAAADRAADGVEVDRLDVRLGLRADA